MMDDPHANPRSRDIASMSVADAVALINDEDARVAEAVRGTLPDVVRAIEGIVARLEKGGRVLDVGCGAGRVCIVIAHAFPGCEVVGLDPDAESTGRRALRRYVGG